MPELPDVEGFRRVVTGNATGRRVTSVQVHDAQSLRLVSPDELADLLPGRYLVEPRRHGKWLVLPSATSPQAEPQPPILLVHFGMTGMFVWCAPEDGTHRHDRVVVRFDEGELRYRDMRKLTGISVARSQSDVDAVLDELGPDAATAPRATYRSRLTRTRRQIKAALMDQSTIAGLGNLCVDEILWRARMHPRRSTAEIGTDGWALLHQRTRSVLRSSMTAGCVPGRPSWLTGHRDEQGGQCPRCRKRLRRDTMAGRSTVWCPTCQAS